MSHARNHSFSHKQRSFNRPLQHFSNLQMHCPGKHETSFNQGEGLLLQLTFFFFFFFFFTIPHRVGGPETMNRLPRPWNCTHACVTRWKEHLLWLSASSHRPPAAKRWNRSHVGQTSMTNGNIENQGGIMQFWQITYPLIPICSRVQITFHRTFRLLRVWNAQPEPLVHFIYSFIFVLVSFVVLILDNRGQPVHFASPSTGWERADLIT